MEQHHAGFNTQHGQYYRGGELLRYTGLLACCREEAAMVVVIS
jgi:hypothetical protein